MIRPPEIGAMPRNRSSRAVLDAERIDLVDTDTPAPQGRPCRTCGGPVEPPDKFCPACGSPQQAAAPPATAEAVDAGGKKHFRCKNCGSEVATDPDRRSYTCPFCDSTYVVELSPEQSGRQRPEFVIGFAVTREKAREQFRRWIRRNSWFRPGDLSRAKVEQKLRGVYLPFWSFSMLAQSGWSASIGEYWHRTETYTTTDSKGKTVTRTRTVRETEWWDLSGRHHRYYSGYLVSGSRGLAQRDADRIGPFHLPALKRFEPYFLAGWLSEEYSISADEALKTCRSEFYRREQRNVEAFLPGDTHRGLSVRTDFHHINSDLCLLPVYVLSYRYKNKVFRYLINGQTGKEVGDKPLSWARIGLLAGGAAAAIAVIVLIWMLLFGMLAT